MTGIPRVDDVWPTLSSAGQFILGHAGARPRLKAGRGNLVTGADQRVESFVSAELEGLGFGPVVRGEESSSDDDSAPTGRGWIVDPIDGTQNFVHKYPASAVSVAWTDGSQIRAGFVYDMWLDELFVGVSGEGASRNGEPIQPGSVGSLAEALVGTGVPYDPDRLEDFFTLTRFLVERTEGVRIKGPASLDLCYVACGRLDAYIEFDLQWWDYAAGRVIVEEAGASFSGLDRSVITTEKSSVASAHTGLLNELLTAYAEHA